jgi:glycosyltransferase involved in cell wall biosynthesis
MRVLYASERPPFPFFLGGAARCAHRLLFALASELDVECMAVGASDYRVTPWSFPDPADYASLEVRGIVREDGGGTIDCGYPVRVLPDFNDALATCIDTFKPDVIWAQLEGAKEVLALALAKGIQGVLYVHDAESDPAELRAIASLKCHVVCSSRFLADKMREIIGRPAHVVYPAVTLCADTKVDPSGYVTMINPHRVKGIRTFLEIARRLPSEKFLVLESWKLSDADFAALESDLRLLPNVRFVRRVSDMRPIYGQTKLLLIPSVWEEGFGMVAVEAQSCGIPVIASARGGLPESVGSGGLMIEDYQSVDRWVSAIAGVLDNPAGYAKWSERALVRTKQGDFAPGRLARRFLDVCQMPAPRMSGSARVLEKARDGMRKVPVLDRWLRRVVR